MCKYPISKSWTAGISLILACMLVLLPACESEGPKPVPPGELSLRDRALSDGVIRKLTNCSYSAWYLPVDSALAAAQIPKINEDLTVRTGLALPGVLPGQTAFVLALTRCASSSTDPFPQSIFHVLIPIKTPVFPETRIDPIDIDFYEIARYSGYKKELDNLNILEFPPIEATVFSTGTITGNQATFNGDIVMGTATEFRLVGSNHAAPIPLTTHYRYWHVTANEVLYSDYAMTIRQSHQGTGDSVEIRPASLLGTILGVQPRQVLVAGSEYAQAIDTIAENVRLIKE